MVLIYQVGNMVRYDVKIIYILKIYQFCILFSMVFMHDISVFPLQYLVKDVCIIDNLEWQR